MLHAVGCNPEQEICSYIFCD